MVFVKCTRSTFLRNKSILKKNFDHILTKGSVSLMILNQGDSNDETRLD